MKLLKYFSFAAISLCMVACSDDDVVLNTATGVTVNVEQATLSINEDNAGSEVSFKVPLALSGEANGPVRVTVEFAPVGADGAVEDVDYIATSKVINISEEDKEANVEFYTVPNDVEDDTKSFTVTITSVEGATIGQTYQTTVTLVDNDVVIPAEWEDLGMCTFTDPVFSNMYFEDQPTVSYKVQLQRNAEDPTEYRLVDPYGIEFANALAKAAAPGKEEDFIAEMDADCDVFYVKDTETEHHYLYFYIMDLNEEEDGEPILDKDGVYIPTQYLPLDWGDGQLMVLSYGYYAVAYSGATYSEAKASGLFGTYYNGVVKFPSNTILAAIGSQLYYANYGKDVNLVVEAGVQLGDYSASIDYLGLYSAVDGTYKTVASVTTGKDVKIAQVACAKGTADNLVQAIKEGTAENVVTVTGSVENETVTFPITSEGTYSFAVVTSDGSAYQESASVSAKISFGSNNNGGKDDADWDVIGYADYEDGWIIPAFQFTSDGGATYEPGDPADFVYTVQVKEHKTTKGLYKLVAPYGDEYPLYAMGLTRQDTDDTDIIFNAVDPNCVIVEPQYSGFYYNSGSSNWGEHYILNAEGLVYYNGYTETNEIHDLCTTELGLTEDQFSFMEDGVIYIPLPMFGNLLTDNNLGYNWKNIYPTVVYLPETATRAASPAKIKAAAKAKAAKKAAFKAKYNKKAQAVRSFTRYKSATNGATVKQVRNAKTTNLGSIATKKL